MKTLWVTGEQVTAADFNTIGNEMNGKLTASLIKRTITANYTLVLEDGLDRILHVTAAGAVTITLPQDSGANILQEIAIPWRQYGAGQITFVAGTAALRFARGGAYKSAGQYAEGTVTKVDFNTWVISGDVVV